MDLLLVAGYITAAEPGLYFIPGILKDLKRRQKQRQCFNWQRVDTYVRLGGVRFEDTILVTDGGAGTDCRASERLVKLSVCWTA
jgi:Xaa-Pro aminopeptidase